MSNRRTRKPTKCNVQLFAISSLKLKSIAVVYAVSMLCVLSFILALNYYRLDSLFKNIIEYQLVKLDYNIEIYVDILKDKMRSHVTGLEDSVSYNNHITEITQAGDRGMTTEAYLSKLNAAYNQYHNNIHNVDIVTVFFVYNHILDQYVLPEKSILIDTGPSVTTADILDYLHQFSIPQRGIANVDVLPEMPHRNLNVFKIISINNKWYLTSTIRYKNTNIFMLSATNIVSPIFNDWLSSPICSPKKTGTMFYATIQDPTSGLIIFHPKFYGANTKTLQDLPKVVWESDKRIVEYKFEGMTRYMYSKQSTSVPDWAVSIIFNKGPIFKQVLYTNIPSILIVLLFNMGILYIYITTLGGDKHLDAIKEHSVICAGDGICIMEQIKCTKRLTGYIHTVAMVRDLIAQRIASSDDHTRCILDRQIDDNLTSLSSTIKSDMETLTDAEYFFNEYKKKHKK